MLKVSGSGFRTTANFSRHAALLAWGFRLLMWGWPLGSGHRTRDFDQLRLKGMTWGLMSQKSKTYEP